MFFILIALNGQNPVTQFGGSARFLSKFGKNIEGLAAGFEEELYGDRRVRTGDGRRYDRAGAGAGAHMLGAGYCRYTKCWARNPSMFAEYAAGL